MANKDLHIVTSKQLEQAKAAHAKLLTAFTEFGALLGAFDNHAEDTPVLAPKVRKPRAKKNVEGASLTGSDSDNLFAPVEVTSKVSRENIEDEQASETVREQVAPVLPIKQATPKAAPKAPKALPKRPGPAMPGSKRASR